MKIIIFLALIIFVASAALFDSKKPDPEHPTNSSDSTKKNPVYMQERKKIRCWISHADDGTKLEVPFLSEPIYDICVVMLDGYYKRHSFPWVYDEHEELELESLFESGMPIIFKEHPTDLGFPNKKLYKFYCRKSACNPSVPIRSFLMINYFSRDALMEMER